MLKLILVELKKILSKKSIYVIMVIMLAFNLLNNILFYRDYDKDGNYKHLNTSSLSNEKKILEDELLKYDYNNEDDVSFFINIKTKLDLIKIKENYKNDSWQYHKIEDYLKETIEKINIYTYQIKDINSLNLFETKLSFYLEKLETDDWKYFVNEEIVNLEQQQVLLKEQIKIINNKEQSQKIEQRINDNELNLQILKYRIKNNVKDDKNYINMALNDYKNNIELLESYEKKENLTNIELIEYQTTKKSVEESKYILKNKINYNKQNNLNYQLRTIVDDYEIFIIILILIVASTIVAEEFQNGTIKLLLIKPYSRGKILLSKYFATIIILLFIICYLIFIQILIGGIFFGLDSLEIPVIVYDFNKEIIIEYNVFLYMIIRIITKIPMIIMILTISFSLSTIINNVSLAITIPLLIYMFTPSINYLIVQYKIELLKYFFSINWNFNNYLFGKSSEIEGLNLKFSLIVLGIYFILIIIFTYFNFKKKNIRNV